MFVLNEPLVGEIETVGFVVANVCVFKGPLVGDIDTVGLVVVATSIVLDAGFIL